MDIDVDTISTLMHVPQMSLTCERTTRMWTPVAMSVNERDHFGIIVEMITWNWSRFFIISITSNFIMFIWFVCRFARYTIWIYETQSICANLMFFQFAQNTFVWYLYYKWHKNVIFPARQNEWLHRWCHFNANYQCYQVFECRVFQDINRFNLTDMRHFFMQNQT